MCVYLGVHGQVYAHKTHENREDYKTGEMGLREGRRNETVVKSDECESRRRKN